MTLHLEALDSPWFGFLMGEGGFVGLSPQRLTLFCHPSSYVLAFREAFKYHQVSAHRLAGRGVTPGGLQPGLISRECQAKIPCRGCHTSNITAPGFPLLRLIIPTHSSFFWALDAHQSPPREEQLNHPNMPWLLPA